MTQHADDDRDARYRQAYGHLGFEVLGPTLEFSINGDSPPRLRRLTIGQDVIFHWPGRPPRAGTLIKLYRIGPHPFGVVVLQAPDRVEREYRVPTTDIEELPDDNLLQ